MKVGSVHGKGLMFVLGFFLPVREKKKKNGTIREWHLSGSKAVCVCVSVTFIFNIKVYLISLSGFPPRLFFAALDFSHR